MKCQTCTRKKAMDEVFYSRDNTGMKSKSVYYCPRCGTLYIGMPLHAAVEVHGEPREVAATFAGLVYYKYTNAAAEILVKEGRA